jgi:hypothetical protein
MEGDTPVRLRAAFGFAYALNSIESGKPGTFIQLSTFEDQHTGPGPEELARNCQAGWTAANYGNVRVNYSSCINGSEIVDLQAPFSDGLYH